MGVVGGTSTLRSVRRRSVRRVITRILGLVIVVAAVVGLRYHDQIRRYVTHLKGSPTHTVSWTPFPDDLPPELHLIAVGDIGYSSSRLRTTAAAIAELDALQSADTLALLGDNAYPSGDPVLLADTVFGPFGPMLDGGTELLAILGNHDVMDGNADGQVAALGMTGRWWARHDGDVLIVGLDSNLVDDPAQLAWLEDVLSSATEPWRIVLLHHPPYSAGYQGSNEAVRDAFTPLFERYGVQLVLSGHDHDYQRSNAINGVTYVVSGGAATTRRTGDADFTAVSFSWHHFVEVAVFPDRLVLRAVNQDLRVADEAIIQP
jgi:3',5'-cyclic AMP phosphodiesterase CpdA